MFHSPTALIHSGVSITLLNSIEESQNFQQIDHIANIVKLQILIKILVEYIIFIKNLQPSLKQRIVKRGFEEFVIPSDEPPKVDHLLFIVHGIGSYCDLKMRPIYEVGMSLFETCTHIRL